MDDNFSCPKGNFAWLYKNKTKQKTSRKKRHTKKEGEVRRRTSSNG